MDNIGAYLSRVAKPAGPLERALLPALKVGRYKFEGFFDREGNYFERVTRYGRDYRREWFRLPADGCRMLTAAA